MNKNIHRKLKMGGFYCDCANDRHGTGLDIGSIMSFIGTAVGLSIGTMLLNDTTKMITDQ